MAPAPNASPPSNRISSMSTDARQSVGVYPVSNSAPEPSISNWKNHGFRRERPSPERGSTSTDDRLNAILLAVQAGAAAHTGRALIRRLDHADTAPQQRPRLGLNMARLARSRGFLTENVFISRIVGFASITSDSQLAPGSVSSRLERRRLSFGFTPRRRRQVASARPIRNNPPAGAGIWPVPTGGWNLSTAAQPTPMRRAAAWAGSGAPGAAPSAALARRCASPRCLTTPC